jgi:hypothetical protein
MLKINSEKISALEPESLPVALLLTGLDQAGARMI